MAAHGNGNAGISVFGYFDLHTGHDENVTLQLFRWFYLNRILPNLVPANCCVRHVNMAGNGGSCMQFGVLNRPKPRALVRFDALSAACNNGIGIPPPNGKRITTKAPTFHFTYWGNVVAVMPPGAARTAAITAARQGAIAHRCGCGEDCCVSDHLEVKTQAANLIDAHFHYVLEDTWANNNAQYQQLYNLMLPRLQAQGQGLF
jgi:hypothetical protein